MRNKDYYLILGVPRPESPSGIRAAFRELAKRYHPERIGPPGTHFFHEILSAYRVLADPEKRRHYDQGLLHAEGRAATQGEPIIAGPGVHPAAPVPEPMPILRGFAAVYPPCAEMRERVRKSFSRAEVPDEGPVQSVNLQVILPPAEAARGGMALITIPVFYPCPTCGGSGREWLFPCPACPEQGMLEEEETVRVHIPPLVRDDTLREVPMRGFGIHNICLRLYIRVVA